MYIFRIEAHFLFEECHLILSASPLLVQICFLWRYRRMHQILIIWLATRSWSDRLIGSWCGGEIVNVNDVGMHFIRSEIVYGAICQPSQSPHLLHLLLRLCLNNAFLSVCAVHLSLYWCLPTGSLAVVSCMANWVLIQIQCMFKCRNTCRNLLDTP